MTVTVIEVTIAGRLADYFSPEHLASTETLERQLGEETRSLYNETAEVALREYDDTTTITVFVPADIRPNMSGTIEDHAAGMKEGLAGTAGISEEDITVEIDLRGSAEA